MGREPNPGWRARAAGAVERLPPGSFAFVMATGIVAIACRLHEFPAAPKILGALNWAAYGLLWTMTLARLALFPHRMAADFADHMRGSGFLTMVAATSVIGAQTLAIEHDGAAAAFLWAGAVALWFAILYPFLVAMALTQRKPPLAEAIDGGWLLAVVATQSLAVLGGAIGAAGAPPAAIQFLCLSAFMTGLLLYVMIITLIFYRVSFFPLAPGAFGPLYWIDTGGAAITTLAGATLLMRAAEWPVLRDFVPFVAGATVFAWAAATFWLPLLAAMFGWRYFVRKVPFAYEPGLWGMVFPIGMYAVATFALSRAETLPFLEPVSLAFAVVALCVWLLTFGAFLVSLGTGGRGWAAG